MRAPDWFYLELKVFDPLLRLRWSVRHETWQLERQIATALHPGTLRTDTESDSYIRARDGFVLVATIPPYGLTRSVFAKLRASDLWSNGGWKRIADQADEFDRMREEKSWENFSTKVVDASKDLYETLKIRDGRTVFNAGWIQNG